MRGGQSNDQLPGHQGTNCEDLSQLFDRFKTIFLTIGHTTMFFIFVQRQGVFANYLLLLLRSCIMSGKRNYEMLYLNL